MTAPALVLRDVTVRWEAGAEPAVAGVSLAIDAGERVALVGLNGSGKTSLLLAAVGLAPFEGEIVVRGVSLSRRTLAQIRAGIGFLFNVPEDQLLLPKVVDDVAFGLSRQGVAAAEAQRRAHETLSRLGVGGLAELPSHHLSHGQKQRVALAGALVGDPALLLLDEPSAGLDPPARRALAGLLSGLDAAMLVATHDLDLAARCCTRFVLLERGRLVADGAGAAAVTARWGEGAGG